MMALEAYHPEKGPLLRQLTEGERFIGYYVLRRKHLEPFRDPSRGYFLSIMLGDRSGQMAGRVWEGAEDVDAEVLAGDVVKVDGEMESYLDRLQVRVLRIRPAEPHEYDLRDLLPSSPRDPETMLAELNGYLGQIENPDLTQLVGYFFGDQAFLRQFSQAPAAKQIHHAYLHGLLEHTLELLKLAGTVLEIYPQVDAELLYTGVLLHDVGKVREFNWDFDIDYSNEGRLLGHIVMTDEMVSAALQNLPDFPAELALQLRHMLLAHHGKYEWGSPRRPMTLEAIALHHIENMSAQINRFQTIIDQRPLGEEWSGYDRLLGRQLYGGSGNDEDLSVEEEGWRE